MTTRRSPWGWRVARRAVEVRLRVLRGPGGGAWSWCVSWSLPSGGGGTGPFVKHCRPLPTREAALEDAVAWLERRLRASDANGPRVVAMWRRAIAEPHRMSL